MITNDNVMPLNLPVKRRAFVKMPNRAMSLSQVLHVALVVVNECVQFMK